MVAKVGGGSCVGGEGYGLPRSGPSYLMSCLQNVEKRLDKILASLTSLPKAIGQSLAAVVSWSSARVRLEPRDGGDS